MPKPFVVFCGYCRNNQGCKILVYTVHFDAPNQWTKPNRLNANRSWNTLEAAEKWLAQNWPIPAGQDTLDPHKPKRKIAYAKERTQ